MIRYTQTYSPQAGQQVTRKKAPNQATRINQAKEAGPAILVASEEELFLTLQSRLPTYLLKTTI